MPSSMMHNTHSVFMEDPPQIVFELLILELSLSRSSCAKQNRKAEHTRLRIHGGPKFSLLSSLGPRGCFRVRVLYSNNKAAAKKKDIPSSTTSRQAHIRLQRG